MRIIVTRENTKHRKAKSTIPHSLDALNVMKRVSQRERISINVYLEVLTKKTMNYAKHKNSWHSLKCTAIEMNLCRFLTVVSYL